MLIEGCEESILKEFIDEIFDDIQDISPEIMEIVDEYLRKLYVIVHFTRSNMKLHMNVHIVFNL